MPWVRFDDQFPIHRKVAGLSDAAFRLHVSAIFWCARNLMDGYVPREDLDDVCARVRTPARFAAECVRRRAWHEAPEPCDSPKCPPPVDSDGWRIHDYLEYQPSAEQVRLEREAKAKRQQRWLDKKKQGQDPSRDASLDGSKDAALPPPPPRPEGSGAGAAPSINGARSRASPPGSPSRAVKPPWCGTCDERTRMLLDDNRLPSTERCPKCHPKAPATYWDAFKPAP